MWVDVAREWLVRTFEVAGMLALLAGTVAATARAARDTDLRALERYRAYRQRIGRSILLGLEFLVAADILNTVALRPALVDVAILGGIVVIRTFLSTMLEVEIEGRWPWRRDEAPRH